MMRIEPRPEMTKAMLISVPILSAIASLVIAALPIAFAGADILQAYREMFNGVFGSVFAISEMLTRATPLMFTGLAAALAFRARLWNIGAEGQLYLGALMAVTVGTGYLDLPPLMLTPVIILMAALAGAVGMAVPTFLKIRFGADEVVTTLLLNFVILIFVQMMLEGALKDPMGLGWPQSSPIVEEAMLPTLLPRMRVHSGLILALVCAGIAQFMLSRTVWGFRLRAVGGKPRRRRLCWYSGQPVAVYYRHCLGCAGGIGRHVRGGWSQRISYLRPLAGVWLYRNSRRHAGRSVSRRRGSGSVVYRLGLCGCR